MIITTFIVLFIIKVSKKAIFTTPDKICVTIIIIIICDVGSYLTKGQFDVN